MSWRKRLAEKAMDVEENQDRVLELAFLYMVGTIPKEEFISEIDEVFCTAEEDHERFPDPIECDCDDCRRFSRGA